MQDELGVVLRCGEHPERGEVELDDHRHQQTVRSDTTIDLAHVTPLTSDPESMVDARMSRASRDRCPGAVRELSAGGNSGRDGPTDVRQSPASRALAMAAARSATWSLVKMLETRLRTVLGLTPIRSAIAGLPQPLAIRSSAWFSRGVSWTNGAAVLVHGGEPVREPLRESGTEDRLAPGDGAYGGQNGVRVGGLEQVTAGAGLDGLEHQGIVVVHGQDQHRGVRRGADDLPSGVDAVQLRHVQVENDHVRGRATRPARPPPVRWPPARPRRDPLWRRATRPGRRGRQDGRRPADTCTGSGLMDRPRSAAWPAPRCHPPDVGRRCTPHPARRPVPAWP